MLQLRKGKVSAQRLSARSIRRMERSTGLSIRRAWAHGGYVFNFVTTDHRHGAWDKKTGDWQFQPDQRCYTSCREMFGDK